MFWILRRTGAANFFNSINNNNNSSKSSANNNNNSVKNNSRPPRKAYGRLSIEADDIKLKRRNCDNPFDDLGNFDPFDVREKSETEFSTTDNNQCVNDENDDSDMELDRTTKNERNRHSNAEQLNRIQAMAISDDDEYDESLTCNVCDRAFHCHRQLASHQQKKRHFGCSGCDSLFPSLMLLEHHKEEFEHWSDIEDDYGRPPCCRKNRSDDLTDSDSFASDAESEDLERLL